MCPALQVLFQYPVSGSIADASKAQRILLVRLSHLGDVVHALPVFHGLTQAFPASTLAWAVEREFAGLISPLPGLARTIEVDRRGGWRAWLAFAEELLRFAPDLVVDCQGNFKSALASLLPGGARRLAPHALDWQEPAACLASTQRAERAGQGRASTRVHAIERAMSLLRLATGLDLKLGDLRFDPGLTSSEIERAQDDLQTRWPECAPGAYMLLLGTGPDPRSWPMEHWRVLALELSRRGRPLLILSGPAQARAGQELTHGLPPGIRHWIGQRGLRQAAAFFHVCAGRGARGIGIDSGPMHLAAACGLPMTLLEGPQWHERTGPWPVAGSVDSPHRFVRSLTPPSCSPCFARSCAHPLGAVCMRNLSPMRVLEGLD